MSNYSRFAVLLVIAALVPGSVSAALIFPDVTLFAVTEFSTQLSPTVGDSQPETMPNEGAGGVNQLTVASGAPFPNLPNSVGSAFASATHRSFLAEAGTGFGETGIFATFADPFDLNASGVRLKLQVGAAEEPEPVPDIPAPNTLAVLVLGLILLSLSTLDGRSCASLKR